MTKHITSAKEIMAKKLITIGAEDSIQSAIRLMEERRVRHLVVVNGEGHVRGILSKKDISLFSQAFQIRVEQVMTPVVEYVVEDTTLRWAIFQMLEKKISSLLVVNVENELTGIITTDDLLFHLASLIEAESEKKQSILRNLSLQTVGDVAQRLADAGI